jgi:hypothetical protein
MSMRVGDAFVAGRSPEAARALLTAAVRLGLDPAVVRTTDGGYIVPEEVADELGNAPGVDVEVEVAEPGTEDTEHAEVKVGGDEDSEEIEKAAEEIADEIHDGPVFDVDAATYPQLRSEAKGRGLDTTGTAEELRARLRGETEGE